MNAINLQAVIFLLLAIIFEVAGTTSMKLSSGFSKILPSVLVFVFWILALTFTTLALKKLDVSFVYPVWSGMGIIFVTVIGVFYFQESLPPLKIISILFIIIGVIGLNLK